MKTKNKKSKTIMFVSIFSYIYFIGILIMGLLALNRISKIEGPNPWFVYAVLVGYVLIGMILTILVAMKKMTAFMVLIIIVGFWTIFRILLSSGTGLFSMPFAEFLFLAFMIGGYVNQIKKNE